MKPHAAAKAQTTLITGASGGIGYELAKLFARDHGNLVLVARNADKLGQVARELDENFACTVKTIALDLSDTHSTKVFVRFGTAVIQLRRN